MVEYCSSLTGYQLSSKKCRTYSSIKIRYSKVSSKCPIEALRRAELEDMTSFFSELRSDYRGDRRAQQRVLRSAGEGARRPRQAHPRCQHLERDLHLEHADC